MDQPDGNELSCAAKLVHVVLANCGPLCPSEIAEEAYISAEEARTGLEELEQRDVVEPVCGVCEAKEEVYALTDSPDQPEPSA
jgi:predicted ArsR family transcriptional regulator